MKSVFALTIVWRGRRGNWGKSELVWSNKRFVHPSLDPICPVLQRAGVSMLCNMLGERYQMSFQLVFERSPPHLFLYLFFIQKKNNTNKDSASFESPGCQKILLMQGAWNAQAPSFFLLSFSFLIFSFYFIFIMANWAWWVTLQGEELNGMHKVCGIFTWWNLPIIEQRCKS